ncbi:hypothetical protein HY389_01110 [Candidatus Daviesbacteria bacterium]|nr:hypothetical protein [Candidatus Daviesbacteria bacterium]
MTRRNIRTSHPTIKLIEQTFLGQLFLLWTSPVEDKKYWLPSPNHRLYSAHKLEGMIFNNLIIGRKN